MAKAKVGTDADRGAAGAMLGLLGRMVGGAQAAEDEAEILAKRVRGTAGRARSRAEDAWSRVGKGAKAQAGDARSRLRRAAEALREESADLGAGVVREVTGLPSRLREVVPRVQAVVQKPIDLPPMALDNATRVKVARGMNTGAGVLAGSVLLDSALEHFRGGFHNPAMFLPLISSSLSIAASVHGVGDPNPAVTKERHIAYAVAAATACAGFGFHTYNVNKREGGLSWLNLFYGAPLGAPWALLLSGVLGMAAERVRQTRPGRRPRLFGLPEGQAVAAMTAAGLAGTVAEAALLHFRGAFQDPFMYVPVTVPPVAAGLMAGVALNPRPKKRPFTRFWLGLTAVVGCAGSFFHMIGVHRNNGGWRNWTQNMQNGPPIPAPPSFTGLALVGLAVLRMLERPRDE